MTDLERLKALSAKLRLSEWKIKTSKSIKADVVAETELDVEDRRATFFRGDKWSEFAPEETYIHELMHLLVADFRDAADRAVKRVASEDARSVLEEELDLEEEKVCNLLATALYENRAFLDSTGYRDPDGLRNTP